MRGPQPSLLRNPDFLKLWTGQTISAFGTQVTIPRRADLSPIRHIHTIPESVEEATG